MDLKNCRRILAVGAPGCGILKVVNDLTGSAPSPNDDGTTAGLTHEWNIETAYYKAKVPLWIDELNEVDKWSEEFQKSEAKEVVTAVGAWVYCFTIPSNGSVNEEIKSTMKAIHDIVEHHIGSISDTLMIAVGVANNQDAIAAAKTINQDEWEDACGLNGFEFINYQAQGINEFGEKLGRERLKETLEANEWDDPEGDDFLDLDDLDFDIEDERSGLGQDEAELTGELYGIKRALREGGDGNEFDLEGGNDISAEGQELEVEKLDKLMGKLLAVKEQGANMSDAERKRLAAQTVRALMGSSL